MNNIQESIEAAIQTLANCFLENPYMFFTEADAVAHFHKLLNEFLSFDRMLQTKDNYHTELIHQEYPTFFRFEKKNPKARLGPPAKRGHYDIAVLNQKFVTSHDAKVVLNRTINTTRDEEIKPLDAVIEFKLDNVGWSSGKAQGAKADLDKLHLSSEASLRYFVVLMRYMSPKSYRWETYWHGIRKKAKQISDVKSIFVTKWVGNKCGDASYQFNGWLNSELIEKDSTA